MNAINDSLIRFHSQFSSVLDELPQNGKATEIARRIGLIAIAPFAYLGLAFAYLLDKTCHFLSSLLCPSQDQPATSKNMERFKRVFCENLFTMTSPGNIKEIDIFIKLSFDGETIKKKWKIEKTAHVDMSREVLQQKCDAIFTELQPFFEREQALSDEPEIGWTVLAENIRSTYIQFTGTVTKTKCSPICICEYDRPQLAQKVFQHLLQDHGLAGDDSSSETSEPL